MGRKYLGKHATKHCCVVFLFIISADVLISLESLHTHTHVRADGHKMMSLMIHESLIFILNANPGYGLRHSQKRHSRSLWFTSRGYEIAV